MATTKIYQHLRFLEHQTYINVNGERMTVHFKNGVTSPRKVRGVFVTSNPDVMEVMDNDARYGDMWKCIKGAKVNPAQVRKEAMKAAKKTDEQEEAGVTEVSGVKTVQEAKEFLTSKVEGLDMASLTNKKAVLEAAAEAGYSFPGIK